MSAPSIAQAHVDLIGPLQSRNPGILNDSQKLSPCDGERGDGPIYVFEPGATITLSLSEGIAHPSYFRIAFDDDGDDDFVEPASIDPIEESRACPFDADDQCGESDFCNVLSQDGPRVLWDNLDPHPSTLIGQNWSWNVTLPDIECDNCTIQLIQVMEDTVHGAYCPQGSCANAANSLEDIYHRCIDIQLVRGAEPHEAVTTELVNNNGIDCSLATPAPDGGVTLPDASVTPVTPGTGLPATDGGTQVASDGGTTQVASDGGTTQVASDGATTVVPSGASDGCSMHPGRTTAPWALAVGLVGLLWRRRSTGGRQH